MIKKNHFKVNCNKKCMPTFSLRCTCKWAGGSVVLLLLVAVENKEEIIETVLVVTRQRVNR